MFRGEQFFRPDHLHHAQFPADQPVQVRRGGHAGRPGIRRIERDGRHPLGHDAQQPGIGRGRPGQQDDAGAQPGGAGAGADQPRKINHRRRLAMVIQEAGDPGGRARAGAQVGAGHDGAGFPGFQRVKIAAGLQQEAEHVTP